MLAVLGGLADVERDLMHPHRRRQEPRQGPRAADGATPCPWRQHERAGFSYDGSIAWRDIPGLWAGTSMPYRPYDLDNERPFDFVASYMLKLGATA
jgi:hypothetical protein